MIKKIKIQLKNGKNYTISQRAIDLWKYLTKILPLNKPTIIPLTQLLKDLQNLNKELKEYHTLRRTKEELKDYGILNNRTWTEWNKDNGQIRKESYTLTEELTTYTTQQTLT